MIKTPTALGLTVASLALATTVTACGGSSSGGGPTVPSRVPAPHPTAAVGQFSKVMEPMSKKAADKVTPRLMKVPGVVRVDYNQATGNLRVYLGAGVTMKQRQHVVQLLADAANNG